MSLLGSVIAGGVAGGSGSVRDQIKASREKALRQLEIDAAAEQNKLGREHEAGLLNTRLEAESEARQDNQQHDLSLLDLNQDFTASQSAADREYQGDLESQRRNAQGWQQGVLEDGSLAYYNLHTGDTVTPEGFTVPSSAGSISFPNTRGGVYVDELQQRRENLVERLSDPVISGSPEESAQIKAEIYDLEAEIQTLLTGREPGGDSLAAQLGDRLVGDGPELASEGSGSAPPPNPLDDTSVPSESTVPTTPDESLERIKRQEEADQAAEAAEAEEAAAREEGQKRRASLATVNSMLDKVATSNDPIVAQQSLIDARKALFETWNSRDDWTEKELTGLTEMHELLINYENQYGLPK